MKIRTILATKGSSVVTIQTNQTLTEAAQLLANHHIGALIVLTETGQLAGILWERDIVRAVAQRIDILTCLVSEVMTHSVITATVQDDVRSVLHTMTERRFRHLPILDQGELAGIISIGDVVKAQLDEDEGEIERLHNSA